MAEEEVTTLKVVAIQNQLDQAWRKLRSSVAAHLNSNHKRADLPPIQRAYHEAMVQLLFVEQAIKLCEETSEVDLGDLDLI